MQRQLSVIGIPVLLLLMVGGCTTVNTSRPGNGNILGRGIIKLTELDEGPAIVLARFPY